LLPVALLRYVVDTDAACKVGIVGKLFQSRDIVETRPMSITTFDWPDLAWPAVSDDICDTGLHLFSFDDEAMFSNRQDTRRLDSRLHLTNIC
jgi:hypothetical protein